MTEFNFDIDQIANNTVAKVDIFESRCASLSRSSIDAKLSKYDEK